MFYKRYICLLTLLFWHILAIDQASAQNAINNGILTLSSSDNTGSSYQPGSEVLNSISRAGIVFEKGSTFEHAGQFYVAEDGIWNYNDAGSTDYFGYAPAGAGSNLPYQGTGIKGASGANGGRGAGRPTFSNLELNSTGIFPVIGGMYITQSLAFNANGPGESSIITTPAINSPDLPTYSVIFAPTVSITGANSANYINGYASVTNVENPFSLPIGDPADTENPLHTLTINRAVGGTVTARYLHTLQHPASAYEAGISWVSPTGDWRISAPAGTSVTVNLPILPLPADDAACLRLVGWNGHQWVNLSETTTYKSNTCVTGNCRLTGTLKDHITDLAIGLSRHCANEVNLTVWPNPTQSLLHLDLSADKVINNVRVLNQQGYSVLNPSGTGLPSGLNVSMLPVGIYVVEVQTIDGQTFRRRFTRR